MKLGAWIVMLTAFIMFLSLMGFTTGVNTVLSGLGVNMTNSQLISSDIQDSTIWSQLFGGLGILVVVGTAVGSVVIGLFGKGYDTSLVYLPFIIWAAGFFIISIVNVMGEVIDLNQSWMTGIVGLIFTALSVGFLMACADYFGNR